MTAPCRAATLPKRNQDEEGPVSQLPSGVAAGMVFRRATAFDSLAELLDWSERYSSGPTAIDHVSPDGTFRGSVRVR